MRHMRYIAVRWHHDSPDDPVELYSEIDAVGWEVRKVEVYKNGRIGHADALEQSGGTRLGLEPIPSLEAIARDPQFTPREISAAEFDGLWAKRTT